MSKGDKSRMILNAIKAGHDTMPKLLQMTGMAQIRLCQLLYNLEKKGAIRKVGNRYEICERTQKKPRLEPNILDLIKVMCWTIEEADLRGIDRSTIDGMDVLNACRNSKETRITM